jgi:hypothetical protein
MQRKSTRKTKSDEPINASSYDLTISKNDVNNVNDDNKIEYYIEKQSEAAVFRSPLFAILKYLAVLILLLPWIVQLAQKAKSNDFIPKIQVFFEEAFTCPIIKENYNGLNCTCDDKIKDNPPEL